MTKDEVLVDVENLVSGLMDSSPFGQVYNDGFKDGSKYALQKLQQYDCSKQLELLEQMMNENKEAWRVEKNTAKMTDLRVDLNALTRVWQMIKERQPIT